jgi:hypothetical protein
MTPVFERSKTVHDLDRAATVTDKSNDRTVENNELGGIRKEENVACHRGICLKGLSKIIKYLSQVSRCPARDSNRSLRNTGQKLHRYHLAYFFYQAVNLILDIGKEFLLKKIQPL